MARWRYPGTAVVPSTGNTELVAAGAASRKTLDTLWISHDTLGAAVDLLIKDGTAVVFRTRLQTTASEGIPVDLPKGIGGSVGNALNLSFSAVTTGNVYVNAAGSGT